MVSYSDQKGGCTGDFVRELTIWTIKVVDLESARLVGVDASDELGTIIWVDKESLGLALVLRLLLCIG